MPIPVDPPLPFTAFLAGLEGGTLQADLTDELRRLNNDLGAHAAQNGVAKGSLTITINLAHDRDGIVSIGADIKTKEPKATREKSIRFLAPSGNLEQENPKQPRLPLRDFGGGAPRDVSGVK